MSKYKGHETSKYKGLFTYDEDSHKYIPISQADGIIDSVNYEPDSKSDELVFDEKIQKAVRAWAEANDIKVVRINIMGETILRFTGIETDEFVIYIEFIVYSTDYYKDFHNKAYTLTEIFGEEEE